MAIHRRNTVMVAECQILVRGAAADVLTDHGYEVMEVGSASEALAALNERGPEVALLFTEIWMPGSIDGLELAHHVRRRWPWIGLLITSGKPESPPLEGLSGSRFLRKTYDTAQMAVQVREMILAG